MFKESHVRFKIFFFVLTVAGVMLTNFPAGLQPVAKAETVSIAAADTNQSRSLSPGPQVDQIIPDFRLPEKITICGESIPLDDRDVYERMDYEFLLAVHSRVQVLLWLRRSERYLPHIEKMLAREGLPDDLKYLAIAESDLRPTVRSTAKATGIWQFMEFTGRKYGLRKDKDFDERMSFEPSTDAAIKYLKRLHSMFGKWTLAMAAYNCGEGCVGKAIQEQEVKEYFFLNLPYETERYVYRIAAIKLILENPEKYGYRMSPDLVYPPLDVDKVDVSIGEEIHMTRAAKAIGTYYKTLKELNPHIRGKHLPRGNYWIYVPKGKKSKMTAFLNSSPKASTSAASKTTAKYHTVKRGETLTLISNRTGVSVATLRSLNNIKGNKLYVGQKLRLSQ